MRLLYYNQYLRGGGFMKFIEQVKVHHPNFESMVPLFNVRFRDKVKFKGKQIEFGDFTKFVNTENGWLPVWSVTKDEHKSRVVDFSPLICVGVAEMLHTNSKIVGGTLIDFMNILSKDMPLAEFSECMEFAGDCFNASYSDSKYDDFISLFSLRYKGISICMPMVKHIVNEMFILHRLNPSLFCETVFDIMQYSYMFCTQYYMSRDELNLTRFTRTDLGIPMDKVKVFKDSDYDFGAVKYKVPNSEKTRSISDGRGLGIYAFLILMQTVYENFSVYQSSQIDIHLLRPETKKVLQDKFQSCIGNDYTGKFFSGKQCIPSLSIEYEDSDTVNAAQNMGFVFTSSSSVYTDESGNSVYRDVYENEILYKKAYGVEYTEGEYSRPVSMNYSFTLDLVGELMTMICLQGNIGLYENITENIANALVEQGVGKNIIKKTIKDNYCASCDQVSMLQRQINELNEKYNNTCDSFLKERSQYDFIIESKSVTIQNLSDEVSRLKSELASIYSDDLEGEDADLIESGISLSDMVDELNNYKFVIVGGRVTLLRKCEELGWTSLLQINSLGDINNTRVSADILCVQSRFVSHKIVYNSQKYFDNALIMYYNGTNIEGLIRSCYSYICQYLNS